MMDAFEGALCSITRSAQAGGFFDATTGQQLRPELVKVARALEMDYFSSKRVYTKVPREESERLGGGPRDSKEARVLNRIVR